jgi:molybdopterin-guanine dinucleotide biosynthesis protein A
VAALLLTGGASRRMGFDKALIRIDGELLSMRIARLAQTVAEPVLEVGPGYTELTTAPETEPGSGPLAAIADGVAALRAVGFSGPALILATDLVLIDTATLAALAHWPGAGSVVPLHENRPQPLCARWSAVHLDAVAEMVAAGERSLAPFLAQPGITVTDTIDAGKLQDADTPEDLRFLKSSLTLER